MMAVKPKVNGLWFLQSQASTPVPDDPRNQQRNGFWSAWRDKLSSNFTNIRESLTGASSIVRKEEVNEFELMFQEKSKAIDNAQMVNQVINQDTNQDSSQETAR